MFKITNLIMYGKNNEEFQYEFKAGLNYFKGKNNSGKTEFYNFIDFMFGSSEDISKKIWYKNSLEKATIIFEFNNLKYVISRTKEVDTNYLYYLEEEPYVMDLLEYKEKLNSIFAKDEEKLKDIRSFAEEDLTYRSFTMFNFLGEKRQGVIQDFLDKCSKLEYSLKLLPILNFIFNKNLKEIFEMQKELNNILEDIKKLEDSTAKYKFIVDQVNINLQKLEIGIWYSGKNKDEIIAKLNEMKNMEEISRNKKQKNIADLEVMYSNISEQIKIYENNIIDSKKLEKDNSNRKLLLEKFEILIEENNSFEYLISPLKNLVSELDTTISFNKYIINNNTIKELKKQRNMLKIEIKRNDDRFKLFTVEEKTKAIVLIEGYLSSDISSSIEEIELKKKKIKEIKKLLKSLKNSADIQKIKNLSEHITDLYISAHEISSVVNQDLKQNGFKIDYLKKGNILQPSILKAIADNEESQEFERENYYTGSMARHTLIQLSGYLGFIIMLLKEDRFPIIPILVLDHISKPFDQNNSKAIGKVISRAYEMIEKENLQIFIFDDKEYEALGIVPDYYDDLVTEIKTGFNPFYNPFLNIE